MKTIIRISSMLLFVLTSFFIETVQAQSIIDPSDPVITYNPAAPPAQPAYGQIGKWVRTKRMSWNSDSYKAYFYKGSAFRLKFPKTYNPTANDGKKYPLMIFFHGLGEGGSIYDNEYSLFHGGQQFASKVDNGTFDGYILVMQSQDGYWGNGHFAIMKELIDYLTINNKVDPFHVIDNGLSAGGAGSWDMLIAYPTYITASMPMSASCACYNTPATINKIKFTPMWVFQGGLDIAPDPYTTQQLRNAILSAGGNFKYTEYPNLGHGTWDAAWAESDFYPFALRAYAANPWPLNGRTEFCPGETVNQTLGLAPGFTAYEWRKDGVVIPGATSNTYQATALGTYSARILRGSIWSDTSHTAVVLKLKAPTVPPAITIPALTSKVLPALDSSTGVTLQVPATYASYVWQKSPSTTTIGSSDKLFVTTPGDYKVQVTEQFGCSSDFTNIFTVVNANGTNKPSPATGLTVTTLSKTSLKLDWTDNPAPQFNETNFEIYQGAQAGGPYSIVAITGANVSTFTFNNLKSGVRYYYKVRAVNNSAAAAASNEASGSTTPDIQAPTAPGNLTLTGSTRNSASFTWTASTDDVGVTGYNIYVNGQYVYSTTNLQFSVYNLTYGQSYNITVRAKDATNNLSPYSNQVTAQALANGLNYKQYTFTGTWNNLPNFTTLAPVASGIMPNVAITPRTQDDNFAFMWEGIINIPVSGTYYFRTNSDDGSKLYLGPRNGTASPYNFSGTATVNNDGLHGGQDATSAALNLTAGVYPIAIVFYEQGGGEAMTVSWRTPQTQGNSYVAIPNSAFVDAPIVNGQAPAKPTNLVATAVSYKRINLTWTDNSSNENGFEVWRSSNPVTGFNTIGVAPVNATSFTDSVGLNASTTYYYKIKAIGQYGESAFSSEGNGVNYSYYEQNGLSNLPNFNNLTPIKTGRQATFGLGAQNRADNFQFKFDGFIKITTPGVYTFYTTSDDGSKLYIDGFDAAHQVVNNDFLQGATERSGTKTLTAGMHTIYVTYFESTGGESFEVRYQGPAGSGIAKQLIPSSVLGDPLPNATTLALPAVPSAPTNFTAVAAGSSSINLSWTDNANNEDGYEVYRSSNNNSNFVLSKTLPANAVSYKDSALFSNALFFYKVRAINAGGGSGYSSEANATTSNSAPVISAVSNQYMRYGTQLLLNVTATDADQETLNVQVSGLPSFATVTPDGNGKIIISFTSTQSSDQNTYAGITVTATDQHSGVASTSFTLVVNDNYQPHINAVSPVIVSEKQTALVSLSATDQNVSDVLNWSFSNLPSFANPVINGSSVQLNLAPGFSDGGVYVVKAIANDGHLGTDSVSFTITVNEVNTSNKTYINFSGLGVTAAPAPWNNTASLPTSASNWPNLKDETGATGSIGIRITSAWQDMGFGDGTNNYGVNTSNNSGVYPDAVLSTAYFTNENPQTFSIYGLDTDANTRYNFTMLGSRADVTDNRIGIYTIGGTSVTLNAASNKDNTVSINGVSANADGTLTLTLQKDPGASFAYINSLVIEKVYDEHAAPAAPRNTAVQMANGKASLTWTAGAYNASAYQVYRATTKTGAYTLLNPGSSNASQQSYLDSNIVSNSTYYYAVRAVNTYGNSAFGDTVSVTVPNLAPVIAPIADITIVAQQTLDVNITASDVAGDIITLSASGLPAFASFTDNGNGNGVLHLTPSLSHIGSFTATITATDNKAAASGKTFSITVNYANLKNVYVNFNDGSASQPAQGSPWNNLNGAPAAGKSVVNLTDESGNNTGFGLSLAEAWEGANSVGPVTGNNSGIFPDNVMKSFYYDGSGAAKHVTLSGFSSLYKYNLKFYAGRADVTDNRITTYTVGNQTVQLNGASNTSQTVSINGITPDANGQIVVTVSKDAGSLYAYLNAIVIQYPYDATFNAPSNVRAAGLAKDKIKIDWVKNYPNTTGFEVWRSTTSNGSYTLLSSTAANVTTYTNSGLTGGSCFYYKVRAVSNGVYSPFSAVVGACTVSYTVNLNFNDGASNPAEGGNWNNTNTLVNAGFVLPNLINTSGQNTGMNFGMIKDFTGYNVYGKTTGNNSGVFSDNVMAGFFYVNYGDTSVFKIDGLNLSSTYNFTFFGSRAYVEGLSLLGSYKIGNTVVTLNALDNTSNTVQITGVKPDSTGSVVISLYNTTSGRAYINAMVIDGIPSTDGITTPPILQQVSRVSGQDTLQSAATPITEHAAAVILENKLSLYPNPFVDDIMLKLELQKPVDKLNIKVIDQAGRVVLSKELRNLSQGISQQRLNLNGGSWIPGMYIMYIEGLPDGPKTIKTLKIKR